MMKRQKSHHKNRANHEQTTGFEGNLLMSDVENEQTEASKPKEKNKNLTEDETIKEKDDDFRKQKESTLVKIVSKNGKLRRFFQRLQKGWIRWAGFQVEVDHTVPNTKKEKAATPTFGVPGYEEIACIEVEVPDIMALEVDRIRTTCKECVSHPPKFPSRDQVKMKLIAVDRYFGADSSSDANLDGSSSGHEVVDDGSVVHPPWRFILERPLVEQYVLMNNYIRKTSILYEQQGQLQHKRIVEENVPEDDSKYRDFATKYQNDTKRLLRSMHRPKMADTAVQTTLHLEDTSNITSEFSFYPHSEHSTNTQHSTPTSHGSITPKIDSNYVDDISKPYQSRNSNSIQAEDWWESKNYPRTSSIYPTSGESAARPNSGSGSEFLADSSRFAPADKIRSFEGGIGAKLRKVSETPKKNARKSKKVTFSSVIRSFQKPVRKPAIYVIPLTTKTKLSTKAELSPSRNYVEPLIATKSFVKNPRQQNSPTKSTKMIGSKKEAYPKYPLHGDNGPLHKSDLDKASRNSSLEDTEQSTSSEVIKLKPSPAGFFEPRAVHEIPAFHVESCYGRDDTTLSVEELKKYFEPTQDSARPDSRQSLRDQNVTSSPISLEANTQQKGFGTKLPFIPDPHQEKDLLQTQQLKKSDSAFRKPSSSITTNKYKLNTPNCEALNKISNVSVIMQSRVFSMNSMFTASENRANFKPPHIAKKSQALPTESNFQRNQAEQSKTVRESIKLQTSNLKQEHSEHKRTNPTIGSKIPSIRHERHVKTSYPINIIFSDSVQNAQEIGQLARTETLQIVLKPLDSCNTNPSTNLKTVSSSVKYLAVDNMAQHVSRISESKRSTESNVYRKWLTGNVPSTIRKSSSTGKKWMDNDALLSKFGAENISIASSSKKLVFQLHKKDISEDRSEEK